MTKYIRKYINGGATVKQIFLITFHFEKKFSLVGISLATLLALFLS